MGGGAVGNLTWTELRGELGQGDAVDYQTSGSQLSQRARDDTAGGPVTLADAALVRMGRRPEACRDYKWRSAG
jgi:hypothetical protein